MAYLKPAMLLQTASTQSTAMSFGVLSTGCQSFQQDSGW